MMVKNYLKSSGFSEEQIRYIYAEIRNKKLDEVKEKLKDMANADNVDTLVDVSKALEAMRNEKAEEQKELKIIAGEDGVFKEYDDTYDIVIHCESEEEQDEVLERLNGGKKAGEWVYIKDNAIYPWECSECGCWYENASNYCPNCGTKMMEVEE
jgi:hypothetical protein